MNICSEYHDEMVYEGRNCPACETIGDLQDKIHQLTRELDATKELLEEANAQLQELSQSR